MSLPEVLLWQQLRGAKSGPKFRRQHPVGPYIVTFTAVRLHSSSKSTHSRGDRPARDETRQAFLIENGYRVLRIPAADSAQRG
jgi:very-short-patch-repair endonuclease